MPDLKVLFATSEMAPLIKTGGLADVSGALPAALRALGVDVRVLLPGYTPVLAQLPRQQAVAEFDWLPGCPHARLLEAEAENGVPLYVLDCPELYQRSGGPYQDGSGKDWGDNAKRFGLLSRVAADIAGATPLSWHPDLLHCNDWQTGLAPAYLDMYYERRVPSVMTIHNMAFQGVFPPATIDELHLPPASFGINGVEYYGNLSFLKAGLQYADHITTVSPNYAKEIQGELGFGMQGLLARRSGDLSGILNGIDTDEWNPAADVYLAKHYSTARMTGKAANKLALQQKMGLAAEAGTPLIGVVSRLTYQKGLDLLLEIAHRVVDLPAQLVILGSGEHGLQDAARELAARFPGRVAVHIGYSEELSHLIEAGADLFAMPSRFEPCGLNQLYSQRYGTPPIVHATGGLADSVVDCSEQSLKDGSASGFVFSGMTADNLYATIARAIGAYRDEKKWKALRKLCMSKDSSWQRSADTYLGIYNKVLGR